MGLKDRNQKKVYGVSSMKNFTISNMKYIYIEE